MVSSKISYFDLANSIAASSFAARVPNHGKNCDADILNSCGPMRVSTGLTKYAKAICGSGKAFACGTTSRAAIYSLNLACSSGLFSAAVSRYLFKSFCPNTIEEISKKKITIIIFLLFMANIFCFNISLNLTFLPDTVKNWYNKHR